ncbi:hypothetical protein [Bradyrhizobium yuanmingense]|uniref:hypothetical protein n=1 Tax=Bradyrhizobium yuanmingense TaxID=108015 RepID=UPI0023BA3537|nr:hypothetical protein [Bradyrhizobium yuanmingense]MDF0493076.1 hypothetical protein [Bradyrhizobium yuanmingense]
MLLLLGILGVIWPLKALPAFWAVVPIKEPVGRILAGDRFKPAALNGMGATLQTQARLAMARNDVARAEALIWLRIAEETTGRMSAGEADREAAIADTKIKSSLEFNPADSFLWLMLYSMETAHRGSDEKTLGYLSQSYATGPIEGWIALRRNKLALATFTNLTWTTQQRVVSEFTGMVDSEFTDAAALNLMGVGWMQRERLLDSIGMANLVPRESFARRLAKEGLKVRVPGVEIDERTWRQ